MLSAAGSEEPRLYTGREQFEFKDKPTGCLDRQGMRWNDPEINHPMWLPLRESPSSSFPAPGLGHSLLSTSKPNEEV